MNTILSIIGIGIAILGVLGLIGYYVEIIKNAKHRS